MRERSMRWCDSVEFQFQRLRRVLKSLRNIIFCAGAGVWRKIPFCHFASVNFCQKMQAHNFQIPSAATAAAAVSS